MRPHRAQIAATLLLILSSLAVAKTPGIFRGMLVHDADPHWIFIHGRNGAVRRVEISQAQIKFNDSVPAGERRSGMRVADIKEGAEVRITAEQDGAGEWRASEIEILKITIELPEPSQRSEDIHFT